MTAATETSDKENTQKLLGGNAITVGSVRPRCPELLFQPGYVGKTGSGFHGTTFQASPS